MKSVAAAVLFGFVAATGADAKSHSTFRVHAEANENNGPTFSTKLPLFGRTVTIEKSPALSENDVIGVRTYRAADGTNGALFELNEHGKLVLDSLSIERRGSTLFVFVNGRPITQLQIDRRVSDGKVYVASGLTANDIELLKKDWPTRK
jgi:hypothetical protein